MTKEEFNNLYNWKKNEDMRDLIWRSFEQELQNHKEELISKILPTRDLKPTEKGKSLDYWEGYTKAKTEDYLIIKGETLK